MQVNRWGILSAAVLLVAVSLAPVHGEVIAAEPVNVTASATAMQAEQAVQHGLKQYYQGRFAEAAEDFADVVAAQPNDVAARYYLGYAHYRMGAYGEARENFAAAYDIDPQFSPLPPTTQSD